MKALIINYSGNVGKSTIAQHMLVPRLNSPTLIRVETLNNDGINTDVGKHSAQNFDDIFNSIFSSEGDVVVDVGSSNIDTFYKKLLTEWQGSHEFFDHFIIPCSPFPKQQTDTINIVSDFLSMGVKKSEIKVILTMVNSDQKIEDQYKLLVESQLELLLGKKVTELPRVNYTSLFSTLEKRKVTYDEINNDTRDHNALLKTAKDMEERKSLNFAKLFRNAVDAYQNNLDVAFRQMKLK